MFQSAAQYLRMSTDVQDLSLGLQREAIARYAQDHGIAVVATYQDEGRSGLQIANRLGMKQLLKDVMEPDCAFKTVLVYDVSRWGRFQNTDASAYYDYHCRLHGVRVIYVAECFGADEAPLNAIVKNLKRAMAAEYSRELAVKVRAGQHRIVARGFNVGCTPSLGFRRMAVQQDGTDRCIMAAGEKKAVQSDRVRWVLGPDQELRLVRRIFDLYGTTTMNMQEIVDLLNSEGQTTASGCEFTPVILAALLRNEAYIGNHVWGRSGVSDGVRRPNPPSLVTRYDGGLPRVVDQDLWERVQVRLSRRTQYRSRWNRRTPQQLLAELREAVGSNPALRPEEFSGAGLASFRAYERTFGSRRGSFELAGLDHFGAVRESMLRGYRMRSIGGDLLDAIEACLLDAGVSVRHLGQQKTLQISDSYLVRTKVLPERLMLGQRAWYAGRLNRKPWDAMILARVSYEELVEDSFVVSAASAHTWPKWLHEHNPAFVECAKAGTVHEICDRLILDSGTVRFSTVPARN